MVGNLPIAVLGESEKQQDSCGGGAEIIGLELDILGQTLNFRISVAQPQAKLADIVPLARAICTKITSVVVQEVHRDGGRIPCRKGCAACCRYLVPVSAPEAFRLREEILAIPTYRSRAIQCSCLLAARRILRRKPPELFVSQTTGASLDCSADMNMLSRWYTNLKLDCPFLREGICTIYEQRPLACREYFVNGSAMACRGKRGKAEVVEMPVRIANVLTQLTCELENTSELTVILPLALPWTQENLQRGQRTYPATMMVERFVEIVKQMTAENAPVVVVST